MKATTRFSLSVVFALALWAPGLRDALRGDFDLAPLLLRFLGAFFVAHGAMRWIAGIVTRYQEAQPPAAGSPDGDAEARPAA